MHSECAKNKTACLISHLTLAFKNQNLLIQTDPYRQLAERFSGYFNPKDFQGELEIFVFFIFFFLPSREKCRVHAWGVFRQVTQVDRRRPTSAGQLLENRPPPILHIFPQKTLNGGIMTNFEFFPNKTWHVPTILRNSWVSDWEIKW